MSNSLTEAFDAIEPVYTCTVCKSSQAYTEFNLDTLLRGYDNPTALKRLTCRSCGKAKRAKQSPIQKRIDTLRSNIRWSQRRLAELTELVEHAADPRDFAAQARLPNNKRLLAETQAALAKHEAELADLRTQREALRADEREHAELGRRSLIAAAIAAAPILRHTRTGFPLRVVR